MPRTASASTCTTSTCRSTRERRSGRSSWPASRASTPSTAPSSAPPCTWSSRAGSWSSRRREPGMQPHPIASTPRVEMAVDGRSIGRQPDPAPTLTITLVAALALATAWWQPWWIMKARAPQYGQRTLVIDVGPRNVEGDVREVDGLGHYVGIRPMGTLARLERTLAPLGMAGSVLGILAAPWLRRRWLRLLFVLPAMMMPVLLLVDLKLWMDKAANDRDPTA